MGAKGAHTFPNTVFCSDIHAHEHHGPYCSPKKECIQQLPSFSKAMIKKQDHGPHHSPEKPVPNQ